MRQYRRRRGDLLAFDDGRRIKQSGPFPVRKLLHFFTVKIFCIKLVRSTTSGFNYDKKKTYLNRSSEPEPSRYGKKTRYHLNQM